MIEDWTHTYSLYFSVFVYFFWQSVENSSMLSMTSSLLLLSLKRTISSSSLFSLLSLEHRVNLPQEKCYQSQQNIQRNHNRYKKIQILCRNIYRNIMSTYYVKQYHKKTAADNWSRLQSSLSPVFGSCPSSVFLSFDPWRFWSKKLWHRFLEWIMKRSWQ